MAFNILVVDDSAVMRAMITRTLQLSGLPLGDIHEAANGDEGARAARAKWIDLVLVDLNMPVKGGEEMIDELRADPDGGILPIVVVSSDSNPTRHARLRAKGVHFVQKPFTPEQLRDIVLKTLGVCHVPATHDAAATSHDCDF